MPTPDNDDQKSDGEGKPKHVFKDDDDFTRAARNRAKSWISEAVKDAQKQLLAKLDLESVDNIDELKERLSKSTEAQTEAEQWKGKFDKLSKKFSELEKSNADLSAYKVKSIKGSALSAYSSKVRDPDVLAMLLDKDLTVDAEGKVAHASGKALDDVVDELLKAKDYLRSPDFKAGAGTSAKSDRASAGSSTANGQKTSSNGTGKPPTTEELRRNFAEEMTRTYGGEGGSHP